MRVAEGQLESQRLVVMDGQEFFFFDIDGVDLFSDLGGDKKAEPVVDELEPPPPVVDELEPPPVHRPRPPPRPRPRRSVRPTPRSPRRLVPALSQRARQTRRPRRSRLRARRVGLLRGRATTRMSRPTRSR